MTESKNRTGPQLYLFCSEVEPSEKQKLIAKDYDIELFWSPEAAEIAADAFDYNLKEKLEAIDTKYEFDGIVAWHPAIALVAANMSLPVGLFNMKKSRLKIVRV